MAKNKTETEEQIPQEAENKEEEVVEEQPVEEVTPALKIEAMSDLELAQVQDQINAQQITNHLEQEKQKIESVKCPACDKALGLKPEDYLKTGNLPQIIECPKCEMLASVNIRYTDDPSLAYAEITVKEQGYAWETQAPSEWTDTHAKRWAQEESKKLIDAKSTLSPEGQKLFRVLQLSLKKQKLIK
jgi:hypothetical protein